MGRALKDQAWANPEPWKLSLSWSRAQALQNIRAQALEGLYFLLNKKSNFQGPSQKVEPKPGSSLHLGPSQNFKPVPSLGLEDPSLELMESVIQI